MEQVMEVLSQNNLLQDAKAIIIKADEMDNGKSLDDEALANIRLGGINQNNNAFKLDIGKNNMPTEDVKLSGIPTLTPEHIRASFKKIRDLNNGANTNKNKPK